jgi:ferrous iron transport protein A
MRIILIMNLWNLPKDKKARVSRLEPALSVSYQRRLGELGFREGDEVVCLRNTPFGGPRIYKVGDSVFSIARDVAENITVVEESK